jgi:hypothetical protein
MDIAWNVAIDFWNVLLEMSPYLLFGFLVAGVLSVLVRPAWVEKHLGGSGFWNITKASLMGVPLPLCSCGVIPVAASLRRHGAGKGPTTSFLISTPQTGVDSIFVTFSLLGPVAAIFRPFAALLCGLIGGSAVALSTQEDHPNEDVEHMQEGAACTDACCVEGGSEHPWVRGLKYGFVTLPADIGKALLVGLVIAALISALVPQEQLIKVVGGGILGMLVMMVLGVPMYVCATASVPIAAALVSKGVEPGAAMVFLMTGPATNAATIATLWRTMGKRTAVIYLASVAVTALVAGTVLNWVFRVTEMKPAPPMGEMMPMWLKLGSTILLIAVLAHAMIRPKLTGWLAKRRSQQERWGEPTAPEQLAERLVGEGADGSAWRMRIEGMHCSHCADAVKRALHEVAGVQTASANADTGRAEVSGESIEPEHLKEAVESLGYDVKGVSVGA